MTKKEKLKNLLQPYLDANIITEIPHEVALGVRNTLIAANDFDLYDEFITVLENNPISGDDPKKSYFDVVGLMCAFLPPIEFVDDDVDVYEEDEE